jgi:hypothetical protein
MTETRSQTHEVTAKTCVHGDIFHARAESGNKPAVNGHPGAHGLSHEQREQTFNDDVMLRIFIRGHPDIGAQRAFAFKEKAIDVIQNLLGTMQDTITSKEVKKRSAERRHASGGNIRRERHERLCVGAQGTPRVHTDPFATRSTSLSVS